MTNPERQQSLADARNAVWFLRLYIESQIVDERIRAEIGCLLDEFERLDAGEQKRNAAGRKSGILGKQYGALGAEHGAKGGWPKGRKRKAQRKNSP